MHVVAKAAVAAVLCLAAPATAFAASKTFDVGPFTAIEISSGIDAIVTVGGATQSVVAESPNQEELDELIVEVVDGKLHARTDWDFFDLFNWAAGDRQTKVTITVPALTEANANSGADINVTGISGDQVRLESSSGADLDASGVTAKTYILNASSGADLTVSGTCESADIDSSSGSDLRADKLLCADVSAKASSGSSADVYATASLKADVSSGATVGVYGKPAKVEDEVSSGGDLELRN
jgi:hypothetical protein